MKELIERKSDRRRGVSTYFTSPQLDRRRPAYERRVGGAPAKPGMIRPGPGEGFREKRRFVEAGTE